MPSEVPPAPQPAFLTHMKEVVTALIGLFIVAVTLVLAMQLFSTRNTPPRAAAFRDGGSTTLERYDPFQRGKDVLLLLLPLTGAIVGYYTGRVIADRTIEAAQTTATQATTTVRTALEQKRAMQETAERLANETVRALSLARSQEEARGRRGFGPEEAAVGAELGQAEASLRRLREQIQSF